MNDENREKIQKLHQDLSDNKIPSGAFYFRHFLIQGKKIIFFYRKNEKIMLHGYEAFAQTQTDKRTHARTGKRSCRDAWIVYS